MLRERKPVFDPAVPGTNRRTVASVLDPTERNHAGSQCGSERPQADATERRPRP